MTVPVFEQEVSDSLILEKFRKLITDGISVSPAEIEQEFHDQNEKVKLDYVVIKPEDLAAKSSSITLRSPPTSTRTSPSIRFPRSASSVTLSLISISFA